MMSAGRRGDLQAWLLAVIALAIYWLLIKRSLKMGTTLMLMVIFFSAPAPAKAQLIGPGSIAPCGPELATAGGTAWTCPFGDLRGVVNIEGGTHTYEPDGSLDHGKLRLNISPGVAVDRNTGRLVKEVIALSPAPGGGTVMFAGNSEPLASFVPDDSWWPDKGVTFYRQPQVCDPGCRPLAGQTVIQRARLTRLRSRVARLERSVRAMRRAIRSLR